MSATTSAVQIVLNRRETAAVHRAVYFYTIRGMSRTDPFRDPASIIEHEASIEGASHALGDHPVCATSISVDFLPDLARALTEYRYHDYAHDHYRPLTLNQIEHRCTIDEILDNIVRALHPDEPRRRTAWLQSHPDALQTPSLPPSDWR
jgi:hypothetical protein